jgi:hypothetical protein
MLHQIKNYGYPKDKFKTVKVVIDGFSIFRNNNVAE